MADYLDSSNEWDIKEWEQALTIQVGTVYICRECGNLAIVTRGGVGVMEMICCGKPMERSMQDERKGAAT